jgi:hypothetical protein
MEMLTNMFWGHGIVGLSGISRFFRAFSLVDSECDDWRMGKKSRKILSLPGLSFDFGAM